MVISEIIVLLALLYANERLMLWTPMARMSKQRKDQELMRNNEQWKLL